ncbi:MAG TPA: MFS transporter [Pseudomonas sp.]|nr:MFS transporter [Pseudomonas sp.]
MQNLSRTGSFFLLAVACLTIMVGCVIVPGLPTIARQLGVEHAASWLVTVPSLGVIVFGAIAAKLIERLGLYKALCLGLFSYGLLGAVGFMLHAPIAVFSDRLLLGGSTALVMAAGTGLISEFYEGKARMTMIASQSMAIELGGVFFLFIGGLLASAGWRWPFALYLTAWIFLALILIFVPRPESHLRAGHAGDRNRRVSTALRVVFTLALLSMLVFFTAIIMLPLRLHDVNFKEAQVGYFLSFTSLVAVGAAAIMPRTARQVGEYGTQALAFVFYALAHLAFLTADGLMLIIGGGVCLGIGFGLSVPLVNHMTIEQSEAPQRGRNLAYLSVAIFAGQFLSSFMELMPGSELRVFGCACVIALGVALMLLFAHKHR